MIMPARYMRRVELRCILLGPDLEGLFPVVPKLKTVVTPIAVESSWLRSSSRV